MLHRPYKPLKYWNHSLIFFAVLLYALGGFKTTAMAVGRSQTISLENPTKDASVQLAQNQPNLCRQVNSEKGLAVRSRPDPSSERIGGLDQSQQVVLAAGERRIPGPDGRLWVEIVSPINGYVALGFPNSEINLIGCQETVANQPQNSASDSGVVNLCRRISGEVSAAGLAVHMEASSNSPSLGALPPGGRVMLVPNYQLIPEKEVSLILWVEIAAPIAGFITADNLIMCDDVGQIPANTQISGAATPVATNSTATEKNPALCRRVERRVAPNGLAIRANAASSATYLGGVEAGGDVYLVPNYREIPDPNDANRKWLQITAPIPGFISAGNLVMCR